MRDLFEEAVRFALKAHHGQRRKDGSIFVLHPLEVAAIAGTMTRDESVLAAAVLHDTVEDTAVTAEKIRATFGDRVADLVAHDTEDKRPTVAPSDTWLIRKQESLEVLKVCDRDSRSLWLSDKLSNLRSLARDHAVVGVAVFDRFNEKDPRMQGWYYGTVLEYLKDLEDCSAYQEASHLFHTVFDVYQK